MLINKLKGKLCDSRTFVKNSVGQVETFMFTLRHGDVTVTSSPNVYLSLSTFKIIFTDDNNIFILYHTIYIVVQ